MEHVPHDIGFLVAANHIDFLDGFFLGAALVSAGVHDVKVLTATNNYWWTGGSIAIPRDQKKGALETAMRALQPSRAICVFIEGKRNTTSALLPGKTGLARLALWSKLPVLPVGIQAEGSNSFLGSVQLHIIQHRPYRIIFGPPVPLNDLYDKPINHQLLTEATNRVRRAIGPLCNKSVDTHAMENTHNAPQV